VYQEYCNNNSQRCRPRSTLWKRLDDLKIINATLDGYDIFRGIRVLSDEKIMFPKKDNNNDELEELNKLYDKTEQQLDKTNEKIKLLENKLFRSNDLIKMQNDMIENTRRTKKAIYDMNDMITKLDKKYADKINKLTERTNEIDMTVASIQNDQMFSDDESDNNSETTDEDDDVVEDRKETDTYTKLANDTYVNDRTGEELVDIKTDIDLSNKDEMDSFFNFV
jgi:uncharacterized coiled-coil protein SlyX